MHAEVAEAEEALEAVEVVVLQCKEAEALEEAEAGLQCEEDFVVALEVALRLDEDGEAPAEDGDLAWHFAQAGVVAHGAEDGEVAGIAIDGGGDQVLTGGHDQSLLMNHIG